MDRDGLRSKLTAAQVMDVIARLPDCDGQAADAVSAHTQVKMEDAPRLLKIPKSECPAVWIRLPRHKLPQSWSNNEDLVVLLERNFADTHLLVTCGRDCSKRFYWSLVGKRIELGMFFFIENMDYT